MPDPIFFDTETCGFHGPTVLIQWAEGDGPIHLHSVWTNPVVETLSLIEKIATHPGGIVGFNLAFDWFHLCQTYTTLCLLPPDAYPDEIIADYAIAEEKARTGHCLKPVSACDLMLHARKGPYQSTMERGDIRIRKVPTRLAHDLAVELGKRIKFSGILFARSKNKQAAAQWKVYDIQDADGDFDPDFKDVVLKFQPSSGLKALAVDALGVEADSALLFADVDVDKRFHPKEAGFAPFACAIGTPKNWNGAWPEVIRHHISHWAYNDLARRYAENDVTYTRALYRHFASPALGDDDSELACMVGACRWKGYAIDIEGIKKLKLDALARKGKYPTAPEMARKYIYEKLSLTEQLVMKRSTKKVLLEEIAAYDPIECDECSGTGKFETVESVSDCTICDGKGTIPHPASERAQNVLDARMAGKELELYDKLITAGRFHADFKIIGALSGRMAGNSQLNAQGIKREKFVRSKFPLADPGFTLSGGDFAGFEVVLAEACYKDPDLRRDLQTGKKIHGLFGVFVYPHMTYEEILADKEIYTRCKSAVFAMLYGGEAFTLKERLGVPIEVAEKAYEEFGRRYPGVARARQRIIKMFSAIKQTREHGPIEWSEPADHIESMLGFRRYFTLENEIIRALFDLAQSPPKAWRELEFKVQRDKKNVNRMQTVSGATQSALFGAAFAVQGSNIRAAANHEIQSSGAQITKMVQRKIWDLQPPGVNRWIVQPMNVHDEIMSPNDPNYVDKVAEIVHEAVESLREKIPLIEMEWDKVLETWASK